MKIGKLKHYDFMSIKPPRPPSTKGVSKTVERILSYDFHKKK